MNKKQTFFFVCLEEIEKFQVIRLIFASQMQQLVQKIMVFCFLSQIIVVIFLQIFINQAMSNKIDEKIKQKYRILGTLGKGAYGQVYKVQKIDDGKTYGLKKLYGAFRNQTDSQRTFRQIKYLSSLDHPYIVKLKDCNHSMDGEDVYLELELMIADLSVLIKRNTLPFEQIPYIFCQIVSALLYLHKNELLHRDIKPTNVLIGDHYSAKLCDFGHVRTISAHSRKLSDDISTRWYKAPQLLLGLKSYGKEIDIWSLGCTLAEMYLKKAIFRGNSTYNQLQKIYDATIGQSLSEPTSNKFIDCQTLNLSPQMLNKKNCGSGIKQILVGNNQCIHPFAVDLIQKMLQFCPKNRIKIQQIWDHPYLSSVRKSVLLKNVKIKALERDRQFSLFKFPVMEYRRIVKQLENEIKNEISQILFVEQFDEKSKTRCCSPTKNQFSKKSPKKRRTVCQTNKKTYISDSKRDEQNLRRGRTVFFNEQLDFAVNQSKVKKTQENKKSLSPLSFKTFSPSRKTAEPRYSHKILHPATTKNIIVSNNKQPLNQNRNQRMSYHSKHSSSPYFKKQKYQVQKNPQQQTILKIPSKNTLHKTSFLKKAVIHHYRSAALFGLTSFDENQKTQMENQSYINQETKMKKKSDDQDKSFSPFAFRRKQATINCIKKQVNHVPSFLLKKQNSTTTKSSIIEEQHLDK